MNDELYIRYENDCGIYYVPVKNILKIREDGPGYYEVTFSIGLGHRERLSAKEMKQIKPYYEWFN